MYRVHDQPFFIYKTYIFAIKICLGFIAIGLGFIFSIHFALITASTLAFLYRKDKLFATESVFLGSIIGIITQDHIFYNAIAFATACNLSRVIDRFIGNNKISILSRAMIFLFISLFLLFLLKDISGMFEPVSGFITLSLFFLLILMLT